MQEDSLDQEWISLLGRWRRADSHIRVPDASLSVIVKSASHSGLRVAPEWLGVAAVLAIAIMIPFGIHRLDDATQTERALSIVPYLASESAAQGPCSEFTSCISQLALLERIEPE